MKSGIWHLAGISLLCLNMSAQAVAGDESPRDQFRGNGGGQQQQQQQQQQNQQRQQQQQLQQQRNVERDQQQQIRDVDRQQQQQIQQQQNQQRQVERQQNQQIRDVDRQQQQQIQQQQIQQRQVERQQQQQIQEQQNQQRQIDRQQLQQRQNNLPIQSGPGEARQTQPPRQGYYQDNNNYPNNNSYRGNRGDNRPNDHWTGRPDGHGNGWGSGPQYRPGHVTDRVPGGYSRVPYRGQDYFYSDGYWYRPQGPRYVVVTPPYGVRVRSLPAYSQEVWMGSALFFLAAGTYYTYQQDTQDYVVAYPPQNVQPVYTPQMQAGSPYDPIAYPANGQSQEQVAQDKYDCYRWSVEQSSFDPADPNSPNAPAMIQVYRRSMVACLMDRGYTIN